MQINFTKENLNSLQYYIYTYTDSQTNKILYVGKDNGDFNIPITANNIFTKEIKIIEHFKSLGYNPKINVLIYGLDFNTAVEIENSLRELLSPI